MSLADADGEPSRRQEDDLFERWTGDDLVRWADEPLRWVVRGAAVSPTYGQIAGAMKTLKSYVADLLAVSVASGEPFLGRFTVDQPGPVLMYVGEGGRQPFARRIQRIASAMGVTDLSNLHGTHDVAPMGSQRFVESVARDVDEVRPSLLLVDPFYAYHGTGTDSRNLHEEGSLLSAFTEATDGVPARLIVNHFNQSGAGRDLSRITQAGSGEWVDSWFLLSHRSAPTAEQVDAGTFQLLLEIGSRQWGGTAWDLDLSIGRLDPDTGVHDGHITWSIEPHTDDRRDPADATEAAILAVLADEPWQHTRTTLVRSVGGNAQRARDALARLIASGSVDSDQIRRTEGARTVARELYGLPHQVRPLRTGLDQVGGES